MTERMINHKGSVLSSKEDLTETHVVCDCGEFDFTGDWDEMVSAWDEHIGSHGYDEMIRAEPIFLTREGAARVKEIMKRKGKVLPEPSFPLTEWDSEQ